MDMSKAFPSEFLAATDLQDKPHSVVMNEVTIREMPGETDPTKKYKHLLTFIGHSKGLVLNKTNTNTIMDQHGIDSVLWKGKSITIFPTQTDFGGKSVPCIRVQIATPKQSAHGPALTNDPPPDQQTSHTQDFAASSARQQAEPMGPQAEPAGPDEGDGGVDDIPF